MLLLVRNLIAVIPIDQPSKVGSIHLPDGAVWRSNNGIVKYVAPSVREVKRGDRVFFSAYSGDKVVFADEGELVLLPESAILAILPSESGERFYAKAQILAAQEEAKSPDEFWDRLEQAWKYKQEAKTYLRLVEDKPKVWKVQRRMPQ